MKILIEFEPEEAVSAAKLAARLGDAGANAATGAMPPATSGLPAALPEVIRLYERMSENESPRFLEALTSEPLLLEEIGDRMAASDGRTRSAASARAIYRNIRKREKTLLASGVLSSYVVRVEWAGYDQEGAGRYYLEPDALEALKAFLKQ